MRISRSRDLFVVIRHGESVLLADQLSDFARYLLPVIRYLAVQLQRIGIR
jgi:hypothetical protein